MTLLSKLDRVVAGEVSARAIIKSDSVHPQYPQTMPEIRIQALEDHEYYTDRDAGPIHPRDKREYI